MFRTIEDLEEVVKKIGKKQLEEFVEENLEGIAHLIKPKIEMVRRLEGFFCSNCNYNLIDVGVCFDYCPNCLENFACCDNGWEDECWKCYANSMALVKELFYKQKH